MPVGFISIFRDNGAWCTFDLTWVECLRIWQTFIEGGKVVTVVTNGETEFLVP
jgi:hypothetical protein